MLHWSLSVLRIKTKNDPSYLTRLAQTALFSQDAGHLSVGATLPFLPPGSSPLPTPSTLPSYCLAVLCSCFLTETFQEPQSKSGPLQMELSTVALGWTIRHLCLPLYLQKWQFDVVESNDPFLTEMSCVVSVYSWNSGSGESGLCIFGSVCPGPSRGS